MIKQNDASPLPGFVNNERVLASELGSNSFHETCFYTATKNFHYHLAITGKKYFDVKLISPIHHLVSAKNLFSKSSLRCLKRRTTDRLTKKFWEEAESLAAMKHLLSCLLLFAVGYAQTAMLRGRVTCWKHTMDIATVQLFDKNCLSSRFPTNFRVSRISESRT